MLPKVFYTAVLAVVVGTPIVLAGTPIVAVGMVATLREPLSLS
jgi:hypothetical protein